MGIKLLGHKSSFYHLLHDLGQETELSVSWNPICTVQVTAYLPELLGSLTVALQSAYRTHSDWHVVSAAFVDDEETIIYKDRS